jgi:hypothetical protein
VIEHKRVIAAHQSWDDLLDRVQTFVLRYVELAWQRGPDRGY